MMKASEFLGQPLPPQRRKASDFLGKPAIQESDDLTWREALTDAFENIPESTYQTVKDMVQPFLHPIQTAKAIGGLAAGAAQKIVPGEQAQEQHADAFINFMKDRYGSVENLKRTLAKDPVGLVTDVASFVTPAGAAIKGLGTTSKISKLSQVGGVIGKAGAMMEPINIARQIVAAPTRLVPKFVPSRLYQSGVKFSTKIPEAARQRMAQTGLDHEIMPTLSGLVKLHDEITEFNTKIAEQIDLAVDTGRRIPVRTLFREFNEIAEEYSLSGKPITNLNAINKIKKEIIRINLRKGRPTLSPKQAQELKQRIYRELKSYYGSVTHSPAAVRAQKAVAKAAKEGIEEIMPEIKWLNEQEGALIALQESIEQAASRISNRDLLSIGVPLKTGVGGVLGGYPGALVALGLGVLDTPRVKSRMAIVMNRLRRKGIRIRPTPTLIRLGLVKAGEIEQITNQ
jgi:hypothetical protein